MDSLMTVTTHLQPESLESSDCCCCCFFVCFVFQNTWAFHTFCDCLPKQTNVFCLVFVHSGLITHLFHFLFSYQHQVTHMTKEVFLIKPSVNNFSHIANLMVYYKVRYSSVLIMFNIYNCIITKQRGQRLASFQMTLLHNVSELCYCTEVNLIRTYLRDKKWNILKCHLLFSE